MKRLSSYIYIITILLFSKGYGQNEYIRFSHLSTEHGLSQNSGRSIKQDKYGFIWIATESGVNKYDGRNFTIFRHEPDNSNSLANNYINALETGKTDNVYIGTDGNGLNIYNILTDSFSIISTKSKLRIGNDFIYSVYEDNNFNVWIGTGNGLYFYDISKKVILTAIPSSKPENIYIRSITEFDNTNLIVATSNGLYLVNKENLKSNLVTNSPKNLLTVAILKNKEIVTGGKDGIFFFQIINDKIQMGEVYNKLSKSFIGKEITTILEDTKSGLLYIGTNDSGLYQIDLIKNHILNYIPDSRLPLSISSLNIKSLLIDNSGVLWIGTYFNGINFIDTHRKKFRPTIINYKGNYLTSITSICKSNNDQIWAGSTNGLYRYNFQNKKVDYFPSGNDPSNGPLNSFITVLYHDSKGSLWFGSDGGGLSVFSNNKFRNFSPIKENQHSISGSSIWGLSEDKKGNLWIATWGNGLSKYNIGSDNFSRFLNDTLNKNSISCNNLNVVLCDNSNVWVGTWGYGLELFNISINTWKHFTHNPDNPHSISHNIVMSLHKDKAGNLWVGTLGGGLNKFNIKDSTFIKYTMKNGIADNNIMSIHSDNSGFLWIFTMRGISKMNIKSGEIRNYDIYDGLQSNEFSQNGTFYCNNGNILAAGAGGYNYFNPDSIFDNYFEPPLYLNGLFINNAPISAFDKNIFPTKPLFISDTITLSYKQNNLTFSFVALHFSNPSKIKYACKLDKYEDSWVDLGSLPLIRYTGILPGTYTFLYKATNCDGIWLNPHKLVVIILPPFWMQWWFISLMILLFILLIYIFIKVRERKLRKEKRILEEKVIERTHEISQQKEEISSQRDEIEAQRDLVIIQKGEIEHIHDELTSSIRYALRIQQAMLPNLEILKDNNIDYFLTYKPRDIVSGDFYWVGKIENFLVFTVSDCTGHGVPGAFMSMLGIAFIKEIVQKEYITQPAVILRRLRKEIVKSLKQSDDPNQKDGMDISLCVLDTETLMLQFAGANNPLYVIKTPVSLSQSPENLIEFKGDKMPIGMHERMDLFTLQEIQLHKGDNLYLMSDGYEDQFGGPNNKKFKSKQLKNILLANCNKPMLEQKQILETALEKWIGSSEQVDDITVLGIKIL